jgi:hypothetical protein
MASEHAKISYIKSCIRILGYGAMTAVGHQHPCIVLAGVLLIVAEIIGIIEEFGH